MNLIGKSKIQKKGKKDTTGALTQKYLDEAADFYFNYLDELHKLTGDGFNFEYADRLLYQIDKLSGHKL